MRKNICLSLEGEKKGKGKRVSLPPNAKRGKRRKGKRAYSNAKPHPRQKNNGSISACFSEKTTPKLRKGGKKKKKRNRVELLISVGHTDRVGLEHDMTSLRAVGKKRRGGALAKAAWMREKRLSLSK